MKKLAELFSEHSNKSNFSAVEISGVCCDSRILQSGDLFFALSGDKQNGSRFLKEALERGACALVVSANEPIEILSSVPVIKVEDARAELARVASLFHGEPSKNLHCIGVTGTNGKTSIAWLTANLLAGLDSRTALIGTLGMGVFPDPTLEKSINTTPAPHHIQAFLASSLLEGATCGVIEATSQGLFQKRTRGMHWDVAVFSNLTHDHLDLHGDFETYGSLKNELFKVELEQSEKSKKYAVINTDDSWGEELYRSLKAYKPQFEIISYSPSGKQADVLCRKVKSSQEGVVIEASFFGETIELNTQLVGDFHVGNILASVAALQCLGYDLLKISNALPLVPCVPGRLQRIPARDFSVFIDYAHTPDALTSVLSSLREFGAPRIITVFGCGGDRDRAKRPVMAAAVERLSDIAVLTSDNPRTEDPQQIIEDTLRGFTQTSRCVHEAIVDRREAISRGLDLASPGDLLLIAGKGHEDYQEIHGQRFDFDDARVCLELMIEKDLV